jgi:hypothetical protein
MFEAFIIYIYLILGDILGTMTGIAWVGSVIVAIFVVCLGFHEINAYDSDATRDFKEESNEKTKAFFIAHWKKFVVIPLVSTTLLLAYPTKDDLKWIVGGAIVWNSAEGVANIKGVDKLPENLVGAANYFLESIYKEEEDTDAGSAEQ